MPDLIINPQFRDVTRPLKPEEYALLERNILSDGRVHSAIITWKNQIVDGHNRWSIIQKHLDVLGDKYGVQEMDFADEWEVIAWICNNQLGRRNLTDEERAFLIYQENEAEKNTVKNSTGVNQYTKEVWCQNGAKPKERTHNVLPSVVGLEPERSIGLFSLGKA